jgi:hypothetical protein
MKFLRNLADSSRNNSAANKFRRKRFEIFRKMLFEISKPKISILDVGGTELYWKQMNPPELNKLDITILNIHDKQTDSGDYKYVKGNASDLKMFGNKQFDIVFSNSVIEHLAPDEQQKMAEEIMRVGKRFYLQTPSYYFPLEPHFLFPFFQFFPKFIKIWLIRNFNLGWYEKYKNHDEAVNLIESVNLLKLKQLKKLFPSAIILKEKVIFFTKSYLVIF